MSKRRLDKLEGGLGPREAVLHWMADAHAFGSLPTYVESLTGQPEAAQPFVALPAQVEQAVWDTMRRERLGFVKEVTRETVGDTVFLLRLVIGLNVHIEEVMRVETMRRAALYWWSRALDAPGTGKDGPGDAGRSEWRGGVATLRGVLLGAERARAAAEARYLDGRDCLFPELALAWRDLHTATGSMTGSDLAADDAAAAEAERSVRRVVLMARADGLAAAGQHLASDELAERVGRHLVAPTAERDD